MSPSPIEMNARGNPQKKEGKMRIRAFPVSANNIKKTKTKENLNADKSAG